MSDYIVKNLAAAPAYQGPQVVINFNMPPDTVDSVRIVRKKYSYPQRENDGVTVDEITAAAGSAQVISDRELVGPETYYYTLFSKVGSVWYSNKNSRVKSFAYSTGFYEEFSWNRVTDFWQLGDEVGL